MGMTDIEAKKLGFKDKEEFYLYEDVCCTEVPMDKKSFETILDERIKEIRQGKKNTGPIGFKKELFEQYIIDNNLDDLYDKVKNMSTIDRLIEIYIYYSNRLPICGVSKHSLKLKMQEAIELFDGEKQLEYEDLINKLEEEEKKYLSKLEFILFKKDQRLNSQEKKQFDNEISNIQDAYENYMSLLDKMDGRQK